MAYKYKKGPEFIKLSTEESQVLIDKFANALFDLVDGKMPHDLEEQTGLNSQRCEEIYNIAYEWWNNV